MKIVDRFFRWKVNKMQQAVDALGAFKVEYKVIEWNDIQLRNSEEVLSELGQERWRLLQIIRISSAVSVVFLARSAIGLGTNPSMR